MNFLTYFLVILSSLVLTAHFLRDGNMIFAMVAIFLPFLLLIKKRWALNTASILLVLGALVWLITTLNIFLYRMETGMPYIRMVVIMSSVALITLVSGLMLQRNKIKTRFISDDSQQEAGTN